MQKRILESIKEKKAANQKSLAVLIDPDKTDSPTCLALLEASIHSNVDFFFLGGSLITSFNTQQLIDTIKENCDIPIIIFPGNTMHANASSDAILFLSLISGRNPEFLIGQHVIAAPILRRTSMEVLPTGYMLIDGGKPTTVSYISNTTPIPSDKPDIAACTAMAGEMLGLKLIYLDAGSGASQAVPANMIWAVSNGVEVPIIVGGGINTAQKAKQAWQAGADIIVIGNGIEQRLGLLKEIGAEIAILNQTLTKVSK